MLLALKAAVLNVSNLDGSTDHRPGDREVAVTKRQLKWQRSSEKWVALRDGRNHLAQRDDCYTTVSKFVEDRNG